MTKLRLQIRASPLQDRGNGAMGEFMLESDPKPRRRPGADPASDGIYRAIQWLLFLDVVLGLGLAIVGVEVLEANSIAYAGLGLAVIGLLLMVFFRVLAAREAARRKVDAAATASHQRLRRVGEADNRLDSRAE
jgi:hypothetical protein